MNNSTSVCFWSRKYSACVRPVSATRMRLPGGSFIWPKAMTVLLMTPLSFMSLRSSAPSRVRSPTPVKME